MVCLAAWIGEERPTIHALSLLEGGELLGLNDGGIDALEVTARSIPDPIQLPVCRDSIRYCAWSSDRMRPQSMLQPSGFPVKDQIDARFCARGGFRARIPALYDMSFWLDEEALPAKCSADGQSVRTIWGGPHESPLCVFAVQRFAGSRGLE